MRELKTWRWKVNILKQLTFMGMVMVIVLTASAPAFSQQGPAGGRGMSAPPGMHHQRFMMPDRLTPEQQQAMRDIYQDYQQATEKTMKSLWARELELQAALANESIDESRVNSLVKTINDLRSNLYREQVKMYMQLARADLLYPMMRGPGMMGMGRGMGFCPMMGSGMMGPYSPGYDMEDDPID
jgi:Spy/CpxP family protein refolding chaperone